MAADNDHPVELVTPYFRNQTFSGLDPIGRPQTEKQRIGPEPFNNP